jgi:hypothetical protein
MRWRGTAALGGPSATNACRGRSRMARKGFNPASTTPSTRSCVVLIRPSCTHCLADQNCLLSSLLSAIR